MPSIAFIRSIPWQESDNGRRVFEIVDAKHARAGEIAEAISLNT
jgi:hypothetical protein